MTDRIDQICAAIMGIVTIVAIVWWLGVWLPERDRLMWATNDCFVSHGCNDLTLREDLEDCWASCSRDIQESLTLRGNR